MGRVRPYSDCWASFAMISGSGALASRMEVNISLASSYLVRVEYKIDLEGD